MLDFPQTIETDYDFPEKIYAQKSFTHPLAIVQLLSPHDDKFDIMPEFDIRLSSGKAKPDIAIVPKSLVFNWWKDESYTSVTPISVIEIVSPSQPVDLITEKINETFFAGGVQSAWLILPALQTVYILTPDLKRVAYTSGEFTDPATGISLKVEDIFR